MTTVAEGSTASVALAADQYLVASVPASGYARVRLASGAPGSPSQEYALRAPTLARTFGPYGVAATLEVAALTGSATYTARTARPLLPAQFADNGDGTFELLDPNGDAASFSGSASSAAALALDRISYYAPFTHSIVPTLGTTPTHVRATEATVVDCYGVMQFCKSGEVRFRGARRVCNLIPSDSEGFVTGWTTTSITLTAAPTLSGLVPARRNVVKFARASGTTNMLQLNSTAYRPGYHTFSIGLQADASSSIKIRIERSGDSALVAETTVTATGVMQRFAVTGVITDTSNHRVKVTVDASGAASFYACCAQMEYASEVGEYVAVGVAGAASPYNGALVDGVQYFDYYRCTSTHATTRVVMQTDPSSYIPRSVLKGLLVEPLQAINRFWSSRDPTITTATHWTLTNVTAGAYVDTTLLGYQSLVLLQEDNATGAHQSYQDWHLTLPTDGQQMFVAFYCQQGTGRDWITCGFIGKDGTTTNQAWFNLATGEVGTVSGAAEVEAYIYEEGDCWRIGVAATAGAGATVVRGFVGIADADGSDSYTGTSGYGHYVGAAMMSLGDAPSAYVGDTAAAVKTRNAEYVSLPWASAVPTTEWTVYAESSIGGRSDAENKTSWWFLWYLWQSNSNRMGMTMRPGSFYGAYNSEEWAYDNYNNGAAVDIDGIVGASSPRVESWGSIVYAFRHCRSGSPAQRDSSSLGVAVNGQIGVNAGTDNTTVLSGLTTMYLGCMQGSSTGSDCPSPTFRDLTVYDYAMTDAELVALTQ